MAMLRSKALESAGLHALLILYASLQRSVLASSFTITQTRIGPAGHESTPWEVEGIATIEIGGNSGVVGYRFVCSTAANNGSQLIWQRKDSNINPFGVFRDGSVSLMTIERGDLEYGNLGVYVCKDDLEGTEEELNITAENPAIAPENDYIEAMAGGQIELKVFVSSATGPIPESQITWREPNGNVLEDDQAGVEIHTTGRRLILSGLTTSHSGTYNCTAILSIALLRHASTTIELSVFVPSKITTSPLDVTTDEWKNVSLVCVATGSAPLTITWKRIGLTEGLVSYSIQSDFHEDGTETVSSTLLLTRISYTDAGTYTCEASNNLTKLSHTARADAEVTVNFILAVFISTDIIYAVSGGTVIINATVHSLSGFNVQWYRNHTLLEPESDNRYSASSDGSVASLTIHSFGDEETGQYVIVVTDNDGNTSRATVNVVFPKPATASITPSERNVDVGENVEVLCVVEGSELSDIVWSLGDGSQLLPDGVVAEGNTLTIADVSLDHSNTYICTVSNIVRTSEATFDLVVFDPPVAEILYNGVTSTSHNLYFYHGHGDPPSFTCRVRGQPTPSITWQLSRGLPLPSGIRLTEAEDSSTLTWAHRLEYSDSGMYECVASNSRGEKSTARVIMTVTYDPVLDTIFPAPGVSAGESGNDFSVPLEFSGTALTCIVFAWPPPTLEWSKNSGVLPSGVESVSKVDGGIVVSELVFSQFSAASVGLYKCTVRSAETVEEKDVSQLVELSQGSSLGGNSVYDCPKITSSSVLFQLRIATSNCKSWSSTMGAEIAEEFQSLLYRVVSTQCEVCDILENTITVVTLDCSEFIDGGVVFRGTLETKSSSETENAFCVLSQWQSSGSLVSIGENRFVVDSQCSLRLTSYEAAECVEESATASGHASMTLLIAVPVGVVFVIALTVTMILICRLCWRCNQKQRVSDREKELMRDPTQLTSFTHNDSDSSPRLRDPQSREAYNSIGSMSTQQVNPYYDGRSQFGDSNQPPSPAYDVSSYPLDRRPLVYLRNAPPSSPPNEQETAFTDSVGSFAGGASNINIGSPPGASPPHDPRQTNISTNVQPYQIPTASQTSLTRVGVSNPMCTVDEHLQGTRRFSEGPSNRTPPRTTSTHPSVSSMCESSHDSPVERSIRSQSWANQNSAEKVPLRSTMSSRDVPTYSRLNFDGVRTSTGSSRGGPLNREWYEMGSDASLTLPHGTQVYEHSKIQPYASVRNSQIQVSPSRTPVITPTLPPPNPSRQAGYFRPGTREDSHGILKNERFSQGAPSIPDGIPSLPYMQQQRHFETIIV